MLQGVQRGSQKLFSNLLFEDAPTTTTTRTIGRDKKLIDQRDKKLVHRHYYYLKLQSLQYPKILENLSLEFDLAEYTIAERLQYENNYRLLKRLILDKTTVQQLRKSYPFLSW